MLTESILSGPAPGLQTALLHAQLRLLPLSPGAEGGCPAHHHLRAPGWGQLHQIQSLTKVWMYDDGR